MARTPATVDDYISTYPNDVQVVLRELRRTIHAAVPGAGETIRYQMPTVTLDGRSLVHFAAWKNHVSVYPMATGDADLERDLAPYAGDKGTVRFPLGEPVPFDLVSRLVRRLVAQRADGP